MSDRNDHHWARVAREAEGYYELGLYEDALGRAESLLEAEKLEKFALAMKAECLRSLERWREGILAFEAILERDARDTAAYVGLGWCQKRAGRLDLAMSSMERLLEARPGDGLGLFNLACYSCLDGRRERALKLLEESIEKDEMFRKLAEKEEDFATLREDPEFLRILSQR